VPEYLAPGVYVEETSFRSKSIEGVGTSTTAFVGPTLKGPAVKAADKNPLSPELLTSYADFERIYGGFDDLSLGGAPSRNYLAHAVQSYFNNGGARLYVARVANGADAVAASAEAKPVIATADAQPKKAFFVARFEGSLFSDAEIAVQEIGSPASGKVLPRAPDGSVARVAAGGNTTAVWFKSSGVWRRRKADDSLEPVPAGDIAGATNVQLITLSIDLTAGGSTTRFENLSPSDEAPRFIGAVLAPIPDRRADAVWNPVALKITNGLELDPDRWLSALVTNQPYKLASGADGSLPTKQDYEAGFDLLRALDDISIVAAPGYSARADSDDIQDTLITHVDASRGRKLYRIAVLDAPPGKTPSEMREVRGKIDTTRAAMYYPWLTISNPLAGPNSLEPVEIDVPPSGAVCGIYARNDVERGVWKAPANEVVRGALRFERLINHGEQELLNPIGVNCFRFMPGRGLRLWGARTASSDPEWKYVNVRRYFNYLEASIDRGTQWAVFEPNGDLLWANVRGTVADFLYSEWKNGALLGTKPEQAFFVRCDRSTMTQNDLDNGRLVCLIGVAVVKPAEFVIFRIGQKTADAAD
jgi:phage tail sheath protein FI